MEAITQPARAPSPDTESQTLRALIQMREMLLRGEFKPGQRIREIPLSEKLGVSRTPLRLVLDRLESEGLLQARPTVGFTAREFTVQDIVDAIELRGVLEGTAARLAAERLESRAELTEISRCVEETTGLLRRDLSAVEIIAAYIPLNAAFHAHLMDLAKSSMLRRSLDRVLALPFASPNAFATSEAMSDNWREVLMISTSHHQIIVEALANREGSRAEAIGREHARLARTNLIRTLETHNLGDIPGGSLLRLPDPPPSRSR